MDSGFKEVKTRISLRGVREVFLTWRAARETGTWGTQGFPCENQGKSREKDLLGGRGECKSAWMCNLKKGGILRTNSCIDCAAGPMLPFIKNGGSHVQMTTAHTSGKTRLWNNEWGTEKKEKGAWIGSKVVFYLRIPIQKKQERAGTQQHPEAICKKREKSMRKNGGGAKH